GPFRVRYEFYCKVDVRHPTAPMSKLAKSCYAAPAAGDLLKSEPCIESTDAEIAATARRLTATCDPPQDQLEALFHFVDQEIGNEPTVRGPGLTAVECLQYAS